VEHDDAQSRIPRETFVREVFDYPLLDSTSDEAARACRDGRIDPTRSLPALVWARVQTAGRGRGRHRWWSGEGALTFTLVLDRRQLALPENRVETLGPLTGLVVADTLQHLKPNQRVQVKWPNDVWLNGKKVSGVLVEQVTAAFPAVLIGIGVNVNNSLQAAPLDLQPLATSLVDQTGRTWDLLDVLVELLQRLERALGRAAADAEKLPAWWARYCCLTGRIVTVQQGNRQVTGRCLGIRSDGALRLQTDWGERAVHSGTVVGMEAGT